MIPSASIHITLLLVLTGWSYFSSWFDEGAKPADLGLVQSQIEQIVDGPLRVAGGTVTGHIELAALYSDRGHALLWTTLPARETLEHVLRAAPGDGIRASEVHHATAAALLRQIEGAETEWAAHPDAARDTLADPRPALLAQLDVVLTDGLLRFRQSFPTIPFQLDWV